VSQLKSRSRTLAKRLPEPLRTIVARAYRYACVAGAGRFKWRAKYATVRSYGIRVRDRPLDVVRYVLLDPELVNFTYDISNAAQLAEVLADVLPVDRETVARYISEIRADTDLEQRLRRKLRGRMDRKRRPMYGRRLGWYAVARILKPSLIVETGVHDGLGSAILLQALHRNAEEGIEGELVSIDIDPSTGWLVDDAMRDCWTPVYGSTFDQLERAVAGREVGMIIHDSEHTYECEEFEFTTAIRNSAPRLALVSDNAHATSALSDVCSSLGVKYGLFLERPKRHFYPGAGMGLGFLEARLGPG
jgi:methyltransferase family protein